MWEVRDLNEGIKDQGRVLEILCLEGSVPGSGAHCTYERDSK